MTDPAVVVVGSGVGVGASATEMAVRSDRQLQPPEVTSACAFDAAHSEHLKKETGEETTMIGTGTDKDWLRLHVLPGQFSRSGCPIRSPLLM